MRTLWGTALFLVCGLEVVGGGSSQLAYSAGVTSIDIQPVCRLKDHPRAIDLRQHVRFQRSVSSDRNIGRRDRLERRCTTSLTVREQRVQMNYPIRLRQDSS